MHMVCVVFCCVWLVCSNKYKCILKKFKLLHPLVSPPPPTVYSMVSLKHRQISPRSSKIWGVCCDSTIRFTFCHCYHSVICNIVKLDRVVTAFDCITRVRQGDDLWQLSFLMSFINILFHVRNRIMYVPSWWTIYVLTRVLSRCLFPSLLHNSRNKHQINPLVSA